MQEAAKKKGSSVYMLEAVYWKQRLSRAHSDGRHCDTCGPAHRDRCDPPGGGALKNLPERSDLVSGQHESNGRREPYEYVVAQLPALQRSETP